MPVALSLETMTTSDKLAAIEQLWDDLSRHPEDVHSPDWHREELRAREQAASDQFSDLNEAKKRLHKRF